MTDDAATDDRWAWPKGSPQEWAAQYLARDDARSPFRKAMDDALGSIRDVQGYGGMYFVDRAKFIYALEQMIDTPAPPQSSESNARIVAGPEKVE